MNQKAATPAVRKLRSKLEALAARGINGERDAAKLKLDRLLKRYDFKAPEIAAKDIFSGFHFAPSPYAHRVLDFASYDFDVANAVKWAIQDRTKLDCLYRESSLYVHATPGTAQRLQTIAATVSSSFLTLWLEYSKTPGVHRLDRQNFVLGLYDGMMGENRFPGALPLRPDVFHHVKTPRTRKNSVAPRLTPATHPYSVGLSLGKQVMFCASTEEITQTLQNIVKGEIAE